MGDGGSQSPPGARATRLARPQTVVVGEVAVNVQCLYCDEVDCAVHISDACAICDSRHNLVACATTGAVFCNNRGLRAEACILHHLQTSGHRAVRLLRGSPLGPLRVACAYTGSTDVYAVGCVEVEDGVVICSVLAAERWHGDLVHHPAVQGGALAQWLCPSEVIAMSAAAAAGRERGERRRRLREAIIPTDAHFATPVEYLQHFCGLLEKQGRYNDTLQQHQSRTMDVVWCEGLQGPEAHLTYNTGGTEDLTVNSTVEFRVIAAIKDAGSGQPADWIAKGTVVSATVPDVHVALFDCTNGLNSVTPGLQQNVIVKPVTADTSINRMQSALRFFVSDLAGACSLELKHRVLGHVQACAFPGQAYAPYEATVAHLNTMQRKAVDLALTEPLGLVIGPPGTGKTATALAIIQSILACRPTANILVVAPSNTAATNLAVRLHQKGVSVLRYYAATHQRDEECPPELTLEAQAKDDAVLQNLRTLREELGLTASDRKMYEKRRKEQACEVVAAAPVIACTCSAAGDSILAHARFEYVLVDEATQAVEPEVLIPLCLGARRAVLIGDYEQLGPVVTCRAAASGGLGISMFERLLACELPMVTLDVQYRMHPFIGEVTSKEFYGGVVTAGVTAADRQLNDVSFPWPDPDKPTLFWHCDGTEVLGGRNGTSHSNPAEAVAVARAVETLITSGAAGSDIGVITMYDAQRTRVRQELSAVATRHS